MGADDAPSLLNIALQFIEIAWWQPAFLPFLREHGLNVRAFVDQLFSTRVGAFFGWDVIVSSVVLWVFVLVERRRRAISHAWAPIAATLAVGVSLGLPLCLYLRERHLEAATASGDK